MASLGTSGSWRNIGTRSGLPASPLLTYQHGLQPVRPGDGRPTMSNARSTLALTVLFLVGLVAAVHDPPAQGAEAGDAQPAEAIDALPVTFTVRNLNRSAVLGGADGRRYTLRGHIVGPRAALRDGATATLYLHTAVVPEQTWRM